MNLTGKLGLKQKNESAIFQGILVISAVLILGSLTVYLFAPPNHDAMSDTVEGLFWADAALSAHRPLNPDFVYPYAIPFGANLFMLPFVAIFGISLLSNALGMLFFCFVMFITCYQLCKTVTKNNFTLTILGTAIILLAFCSQMGVNLLHHILFYQLGFVCLLGLYGGILLALSNSKEKYKYIPLLLFSLWCGSNGLPSIMLASMPIIVSVCIICIIPKFEIYRSIFTKIVITVLGGTLCGFLLYKTSLYGIQEFGYLNSSYVFNSIEEWLESLRKLPEDWLGLFFFRDPKGIKVLSLEGIVTLVTLSLSVLIGAVPFYYVVKIRNLECFEVILLIASIFVWLVTLMQYTLLRGAEMRLLYNGMLTNFTLFAVAFISHFPTKKIGRVFAVIWVIIVAVYASLFLFNASWRTDMTLVEHLQKQDLTLGFGSYWNALNNTAKSHNKVKIRQVDFDFNSMKPIPFYYNCNKKWYDETRREGLDRWFVVLNEEEWKRLEEAIDKTMLCNAIEVSEVLCYSDRTSDRQHYHILIYDMEKYEQIFGNRLFDYNFNNNTWTDNCSPIEGERHIHDGGISYGPYIPLDSGEICKVDIRGEHLEDTEILVYSVQDETTFYIEPKYRKKDETEIQFEITTDIDLKNLEIVILNPTDDDFYDDVVLTSESMQIHGLS